MEKKPEFTGVDLKKYFETSIKTFSEICQVKLNIKFKPSEIWRHQTGNRLCFQKTNS
jgi:hypothetical protein